MSTIDVGIDRGGRPVQLFYQDIGVGRPIVLIHGWPLDHSSWAYQIDALTRQGFRVIAYDRRGFGKSSQPDSGYDYDTLADDLKALLDELGVEDVTLVGFSMGGGEVARYMHRHGGLHVDRVAFISAVPPFLQKRDDNPDGLERSLFDGIIERIDSDRPAFVAEFARQFFGIGLLSRPVTDATLQWTFGLAMQASHRATVECVLAFSQTDFRRDLKAISVPTLIIHGENDATVPLEVSGARTAEALPHATFKVYDGAPHGLFITDKDRLSADLAAFARG